jgi:hypothetical protein
MTLLTYFLETTMKACDITKSVFLTSHTSPPPPNTAMNWRETVSNGRFLWYWGQSSALLSDTEFTEGTVFRDSDDILPHKMLGPYASSGAGIAPTSQVLCSRYIGNTDGRTL